MSKKGYRAKYRHMRRRKRQADERIIALAARISDLEQQLAVYEGPAVWLAPGRQFGRPCIIGTRVPVETVAEHLAAGETVDGFADGYMLTREQVLTACWAAAFGGWCATREQGGAWSAWAEEHFKAMWSSDYDAVPDPPSGPSGATEGPQP